MKHSIINNETEKNIDKEEQTVWMYYALQKGVPNTHLHKRG